MQRFENLKLIEERAGAHIYECAFEGKPAIVKFVTKAGRPRFKRERIALEKGQGYVPDLYHYGDSDYLYPGGKCLVMEQLHFDYKKAVNVNHKRFFISAMLAMWQLFRFGVFVHPNLRNLGVDSRGRLKWLDFNDDTPGERGFRPFHFVDYFKPGHEFSVEKLYKKYAAKYKLVLADGFFDDIVKCFLEKMYQSLINVHEPIPIDGMETVFRTETEAKDPNYGELVPPNRKCRDRWEMITSTHDDDWWKSRRVMDVGCNIGWFSMNFARLGANVTGYELDREKSEFSKLVAYHEGLENVKFDHETPLARVKGADFIILLSTLNRWVLTDEEAKIIGPTTSKKDERHQILRFLWDFTDEMVVEVPNYWIKGAMGGDFVPFMDRLGADMRVLGTSDNGRKLFYFTRRK